MSADILLAALNARYAHASFGLRYLLANMGDLAPRTELVEFVANSPAEQTLQSLLAATPAFWGWAFTSGMWRQPPGSSAS